MPAPDGPQWVDVYHATREGDAPPPHEREHPFYSDGKAESVFAGTEEAAKRVVANAVNAPWPSGTARMHHYRVNRADIYPVVYGDDDFAGSYEDAFASAKAKGENAIGLWEGTRADREGAGSKDYVTPYRNFAEDRGSISYIMPKRLIREGKIKYMGSRQVTKADYEENK